MIAFAEREWLWLLATVPFGAAWAVWAHGRRRRAWRSLGQRGRAPRDGLVWWLFVLVLLAIALGRPKWAGFAPEERTGHDVVLLVDVSRSMAAEDAVPNRMAVAVESAESLVRALAIEPNSRVAVVGFAGRGVARCPLTENLGAAIDTLRRLRPGELQPGGTNLAAGLDAALEVFGDDDDGPEDGADAGRTIVVFSDGEDHVDHWRGRLGRIAEREIVAHAVAIGDGDKGHPVPSGALGKPLAYRGETVLSRRSDAALFAIAHETGGAMVRLGLSEGDLGALYRTRIGPLVGRRTRAPRLEAMTDLFPVFLGASVFCLLASCWPPGKSRGRNQAGWTARWRRCWAGLKRWASGWTMSLGQRRATRSIGTGALLAVLVFEAMGAAGGSAADWVARGRSAYARGRLDEALKDFETARRVDPSAAVPRYNIAAVLFQQGRLEDAAMHYRDARRLAGPALRAKIDYALGNTALALGDLASAIGAYGSCIASKARSAEVDAVRRDATINRAFVLRHVKSSSKDARQAGPEGRKARSGVRKEQRAGPSPGPEGRNKTEQDAAPATSGAGRGDNADETGRERDDRSWRRRRTGGAGGGDATPDTTNERSPEDRLDEALDNIREALRRRLTDSPPSADEDRDLKDW